MKGEDGGGNGSEVALRLRKFTYTQRRIDSASFP